MIFDHKKEPKLEGYVIFTYRLLRRLVNSLYVVMGCDRCDPILDNVIEDQVLAPIDDGTLTWPDLPSHGSFTFTFTDGSVPSSMHMHDRCYLLPESQWY